MAKDAVATMGDLLPADAGGRDAVHVAVFSAKSYKDVFPGENVAIVRQEEVDTIVTANSTDFVGIVDPFLKTEVPAGSRFWVYLYPRTITSLSHKWGHPAFSDAVAGAAYVPPSAQVASEQWLREWCAANDCPGYETVMEIIKNGELRSKTKGSRHENHLSGSRIDGDCIYISGSDAHGDIPDEFWVHVENVLGEKIEQKPKYFSCSC